MSFLDTVSCSLNFSRWQKLLLHQKASVARWLRFHDDLNFQEATVQLTVGRRGHYGLYSPSWHWLEWTCPACWWGRVSRVSTFDFWLPWRQETNETRPPSLNQHQPSVSPPSLRQGSSMQLQPSEEEKQRGRRRRRWKRRKRRDSRLSDRSRDLTTKGHVDRQDWQQVLLLRDRQGEGREGDGVRGRPSTENRHFRLPSERNRAAPYSRSSSSYNSLYLLLLNLKEKTGFRNKKMPIFCTDTWEKKKEGQNIVDVWHEDRGGKKRRKPMKVKRKKSVATEMEGRGLTKGLSSLGGRDGRPWFSCLPFGRVNSDPEQERKSSKEVKKDRKVRKENTWASGGEGGGTA